MSSHRVRVSRPRPSDRRFYALLVWTMIMTFIVMATVLAILGKATS